MNRCEYYLKKSHLQEPDLTQIRNHENQLSRSKKTEVIPTPNRKKNAVRIRPDAKLYTLDEVMFR